MRRISWRGVFSVVLASTLLLATITVAKADVCLRREPRTSCFAFGADAMLEGDGIAVISKRGEKTRLSAEDGRPKAAQSYTLWGEMLREPSEQEWRSIEEELVERARRWLCGKINGGVLFERGTLQFVRAGGIIDAKVHLNDFRPDGRLNRRMLLDTRVQSCGEAPEPFKSQIRIEFSAGETPGAPETSGLSVGTVNED